MWQVNLAAAGTGATETICTTNVEDCSENAVMQSTKNPFCDERATLCLQQDRDRFCCKVNGSRQSQRLFSNKVNLTIAIDTNVSQSLQQFVYFLKCALVSVFWFSALFCLLFCFVSFRFVSFCFVLFRFDLFCFLSFLFFSFVLLCSVWFGFGLLWFGVEVVFLAGGGGGRGCGGVVVGVLLGGGGGYCFVLFVFNVELQLSIFRWVMMSISSFKISVICMKICKNVLYFTTCGFLATCIPQSYIGQKVSVHFYPVNSTETHTVTVTAQFCWKMRPSNVLCHQITEAVQLRSKTQYKYALCDGPSNLRLMKDITAF